MKTDRELLELAAKATGDDIRRVDTDYEHCFKVLYSRPGVRGWRVWDPLTDDGDALRLAVKLHLDIKFRDGCTYAMQSGKRIGAADGAVETCHRRAIVRAAAAIGEEMP